MATTKVTKFGFSNTTQLHLLTDYGLVVDDPGHCKLENKTCPIDQPEAITIKGLNTTKPASELNYTPKVSTQGTSSYTQFMVKVDDVLRTQLEDGETHAVLEVIEDNILSAYLVVRAPRSAEVTDEHIRTIIDRVIMATKTDAGQERISQFRRLALRPTSD